MHFTLHQKEKTSIKLGEYKVLRGKEKNKNCEISHIVRTAVTPEVYNQRQNALFISECVEHRMYKVTWASLCVFGRMHGQVHVSNVRAAECTFLDRRAAPQFVTHGLVGTRVCMDASTVRSRRTDWLRTG